MIGMPSTVTRLSLARLPCTTRFMPVSGIDPPTFCRTPVTSTDGVNAAKLTKLRSVGKTSMASREAVASFVVLVVSTMGDSPVTVTVSSIVPTFMSALTFAVKPDVSSIPSRLIVANPGRVKATL
jgi:hypothetical protein